MPGAAFGRNVKAVSHGTARAVHRQAALERRASRAERWSTRESEARLRRHADQPANNRVVGAVLITLGANWLLMELGLFPFGFMGLLAIALAVLGAGLIGTAKAGSSARLTVLGIGLTAVLAMSSGISNPIQGQLAGDRQVTPGSLAELESEYSLVFGELVLDLTEIDFQSGTRVVSASTTIGHLEVVVPDDVALEVVASVDGAGEIHLPDRRVQDGAGGVRSQYVDPGWSDAEERLHLELNAKVGEIVVRRAA